MVGLTNGMGAAAAADMGTIRQGERGYLEAGWWV